MPPTPVQNRKYLCQAPRNEVWEDIRDSVISKMGENPAEVLSSTIAQLRSMHRELEHPRTGPGRKSNAEHALFFYQYLLDYVQNHKGKLPLAPPPVKRSTTTVPVPWKDDGDPVCNVCQENNPDEVILIPCRQCPRKFHMSCLHPKQEGDYDLWLCPYCVLEDSKTPKAKRHPAAAAVRVMARWRNQFERKRASLAAAAALQAATIQAVGAEPVEPKLEEPNIPKHSEPKSEVESKPKFEALVTDPVIEEPKQVPAAVAASAPRVKEEPTSVNPEIPQSELIEKTTPEAKVEDRIPKVGGLPRKEGVKEQEKPEVRLPPAKGETQQVKPKPTPETSPQTFEKPEEDPSNERNKVDKAKLTQEVYPKTVVKLEEGSGATNKDDDRAKLAQQPDLKTGEQEEDPSNDAGKDDKASALISNEVLPAEPNKETSEEVTSLFQDEGAALMDESLDDGFHDDVKEDDDEEEYKETNKSTGSPHPISTDGPSSPDRSRRTRKQPVLYDPQSCAASRWATDEEWKTATKELGTDEAVKDSVKAQAIQEAKPRSPRSREVVPKSLRQTVLDSGEGYWCNFCHDDPAITICVFCACRVCFSKTQDDQLVCEECGQQYHSGCLGLPQPKGVSTWLCSGCIEAKKPNQKRVVPTRMRPRDSRDTKDAREIPVVASTSRRSLRPPSSRRPTVAAPAPAPPSQINKSAASKKRSLPGKRPVGRPPKNRPPPAAVAVMPPPAPVQKKRGRPPSVTPRKRGRPPKKPKLEVVEVTKEVEDMVEASEMYKSVVSVATHVTRTGRTVKRSTFHDEVEEGAQLLKSSRKSPKASSPDETSATGAHSMPLDPFIPPEEPVDEPVPGLPLKPPPVAAAAAPPQRSDSSRTPRRKPGARECMQISRRFGDKEIPEKYFDILMDYCNRGKVEHLIRMRERLDEHSRFLEMQLAGLECLVLEKGESDVVVPLAPEKGE